MNNGDGSYKWSYETENGIKAEEQGELKNKGSDNEIQSVRGSYSYTAPDGQVITVNYIADENGFQPQVSDSSQLKVRVSVRSPFQITERYIRKALIL